MNKQQYAVALSLMSSGLWHLYSKYDPETIFNDCVSIEERRVQDYFKQWYRKPPIDEAENIIQKCSRLHIKVMSYWDEEYPQLLKEIAHPPAVIYYKGNMPSKPCLAIVGTRNADPQSSFIARTLAGRIASKDIAVVSGLAIGIDREAHCAAVKAGGATIGVMANGIDKLYPLDNRDIYTDIINSGNGCVMSEYPPDVRITKWTFVRRNRIISGLSLGTVVVKAGGKSGALITARFALEQNRDLFVCTGHAFDEGYKGCYMLLKNGAHPVFDEKDIFEVLNVGKLTADPLLFGDSSYDNDFHNKTRYAEYKDDDIVKALTSGPADVDVLIRSAGKSSAEMIEKITMLELEGIVSRTGNIVTLNSK